MHALLLGKKAIIFDLYGTLASAPKIDPENIIKNRFNLNKTYDEMERIVCGTIFKNKEDFFIELYSKLKIPLNINTTTFFEEVINKEYCEIEMQPYAEKLLSALHRKGFKIGLISNTWYFSASHLFRKYNLSRYFDLHIFSYEVGMTKPNIKIFQASLKALKTKPEEAVMIGNSVAKDIMPARNLGMKTILISKLALPHNADLQVPSLSQLMNMTK